MWQLECIFLLLTISSFEQTTAASVQEHYENYESYVNMSLQIERQDKARMNSWLETTQVQLVDVTAKYRMDMARHQQHSFGKRSRNEKWMECLDLYQNETTKAEQAYYVRENECLKAASTSDAEKRQAVTQVGREIRKWRRSYRFLINRCKMNNPNNEEKTKICLVNYMEKDNFSYAFQRLINLRLELVRELENVLKDSVIQLEVCLKGNISKYLEQVRRTMAVLNICYGE